LAVESIEHTERVPLVIRTVPNKSVRPAAPQVRERRGRYSSKRRRR
jgi:hypothetical protein